MARDQEAYDIGKNVGANNGTEQELLAKLKRANKDKSDDLVLASAIAGFKDGIANKAAGGTTDGGEDDGKGNKVVVALKELVKTQEAGQQLSYSIENELKGVDDLYDQIFEKNGDLKKFSLASAGEAIFGGVTGMTVSYAKMQSALLTEINTKTSLTGQLSRDYRDEITRAQPALLRLGISTSDLADSAAELVQNSGRFNLINRETFERAGAVAKAYVGTLSGLVAMYPDFEKIGIGAADASEKISYAGQMSLRLGLNSKKIVGDLQGSLSKLNEYGFKNGVEGLTRMVQKATEFRMGMEQVFKIADKVMNPEGALELSANLQVLGGAIGDFNDPLKLMYMSTNNVEGLQDALINAAGGLATYNSETKKFELSGVNLRRAREMATQLGVDYNELAKGAIAAAERTQAANDLMAKGLTLDDSQKEFITNLAQMKGGKMMIELQSQTLRDVFGKTEVALEDLTEEQAKQIMEYRKEFEKMDEKQIIQNQYTAVENIKRDVNYLAVVARLQAGKAAEVAGKLTGFKLSDVAEISQNLTEQGVKMMQDLSADIDNALKEGGTDISKIDIENRIKRINEMTKGAETKEEKKPTETTTTKTINEHHIYIKSDDNVDASVRQKFYKGEYVVGNQQ